MVLSYPDVQGVHQCDIRCSMSKQIESLVNSGIRELSDSAVLMCNSAPLPMAPVLTTKSTDEQLDDLRKKYNELVEFTNRQSVLVTGLIDLIFTNALIAATIKDRVITSATASSAVQHGVPVSANAQHTRPVNTIVANMDGTDETSSVSILDYMTPRKVSTDTVRMGTTDTKMQSGTDDRVKSVTASGLFAGVSAF